jgi:twitching motility protein PilT
MDRFEHVITNAIKDSNSDIHIIGGSPVSTRKDGVMIRHGNVIWSHEEIDALIKKILSPNQIQTLREQHSVDFAMNLCNARLRINVFDTMRGLSLAVRILPGYIPTIDSLNLHPCLHEISKLKSGLVLICGGTGSGKTSTISAIINEINATRTDHIITLENPIEYRFDSKKSVIQQRELGTNMPSFAQGLIDVLRQDPDVIVVGELRDPETMRLTLNAAESGHLVIGTLHATNTEEAIYRLCNSFPTEAQTAIRFQVASTLAWLVVQQLMLLNKVSFRVPVLSILRGTQPIKNLIRENKLHQIEGAIQIGKSAGLYTMERYMDEFLDTKDQYISTRETFRPSMEASREIIYHSPIFHRSGKPKGSQIATRIPETTDHGMQSSVHYEHDIHGIEHILTIESGTSIEALIKETGYK